MESGTFQTDTEHWTWSVRDFRGPSHEGVVAKSFACATTHGSYTFSMERELVFDFGPVDDETARRLLLDTNDCVVHGDDGAELARINSVAERRPLRESPRFHHTRQPGRLRVSLRGRRARRIAVTKSLGDHRPDELLAIVEGAFDHRGAPQGASTRGERK